MQVNKYAMKQTLNVLPLLSQLFLELVVVRELGRRVLGHLGVDFKRRGR